MTFRKHTDEARAKISQKARERYKWDDAKIERVKALLLAGASAREIKRKEHVYRGTLKKFCIEHGLPCRLRRSFTQAGDALLKEKYETERDLNALLRQYQEAREYPASYDAMRQHAARLGLHRPRFGADKPKHRADRAAEYAQARQAIAPVLQQWLNTGIGVAAAAKCMGISGKRAFRMVHDGLVVRPAPPPKPPRPAAAKRAKAPKQAKPPKPKALPKSWVRSVAPPKPKPVYETVEAFLAAGGRITRCPAAAVHVTTATMGEGRDVIRRHAAAMAGDDGNWIARAKRKMGRFHFGAQSA